MCLFVFVLLYSAGANPGHTTGSERSVSVGRDQRFLRSEHLRIFMVLKGSFKML